MIRPYRTFVCVIFLQFTTAETYSMEKITHLRALRKAHCIHLTWIFRRIEEILVSDTIPNEKQTAALTTLLKQIKTKKRSIKGLNTRISEAIQDPDALESEILEAEEIQ